MFSNRLQRELVTSFRKFQTTVQYFQMDRRELSGLCQKHTNTVAMVIVIGGLYS